MRITTNIIMKQYNRSLNQSLNLMNETNNRVITRRKFATASEDPAGTAKAYQLRHAYARSENYVTNLENTQGLFAAQESSMMEVSDVLQSAYTDCLTALNGTNSHDVRVVIASKLDEAQKSIVMSLNAKYSEQNIFGGSSTKEPPFSAEGGVIKFRGVELNTAAPATLTQLEEMSSEPLYVDLGFGLEFKPDINGVLQLSEQTSFNTALPGLKFIGFGQTADGTPKDIYSLLGSIAAKLRDPGFAASDVSAEMSQLEKGKSNLLSTLTQLGSRSMFCNFAATRLDNEQFQLTMKSNSVEFVDVEAANTDFKMQEFTYQAALNMGSKIIQPSFLDFMR